MITKARIDVKKTPKEIELNMFYMHLIRSPFPASQQMIDKFKKDQDEIRKENPIYNN